MDRSLAARARDTGDEPQTKPVAALYSESPPGRQPLRCRFGAIAVRAATDALQHADTVEQNSEHSGGYYNAEYL